MLVPKLCGSHILRVERDIDNIIAGTTDVIFTTTTTRAAIACRVDKMKIIYTHKHI